MNLLLFEPSEISIPLPLTDPRARHLLDVLHRREGDTFDAGVVNGPRGKGTLRSITPESLILAFAWQPPPAPLPPLALIVGLPRPQTARDILRDATTLGVTELHFVLTEKGDRNYASSSLWSTHEWQRHLRAGAGQAFDTRVPAVTWGRDLASVVTSLPAASSRVALDNYEAAAPLSLPSASGHAPTVLAIGGERGWGDADRIALRGAGFALMHLGDRVLRTETAVVAALAILKAQSGWR
jgi:16S rRNA (uracil1498-N3)-methyltransferase